MENYPSQLNSLDSDDIMTKAEKNARPKGGWFRRGTGDPDPEVLKKDIEAPFRNSVDHLTGVFIKRVFDALLPKIDERIKNLTRGEDSVQKKFNEAINFFSTPPELQSIAKKWGQRELEDCTEADVENYIDCLQKAQPGCFHWHVANRFRDIFEAWIATENMEFSNDDLKMSAPAQHFTAVYPGHRLNLTGKGGGTMLFHYLLAKDLPDSETLLAFDGRNEKLLIGNLRVLYQMEAGFTLEDLEASSLLKEKYESQLNEGVGIHIEMNCERFSPDARRQVEATATRIEEVKTEWRAIRELLPIIGVDTEGFKHIALRNGVSSNGRVFNPGELTARVNGEAGIASTFLDADDSHTDLVNSPVACDNFIRMTREGFQAHSRWPEIINEFTKQIDDVNERIESERFYRQYCEELSE